MFYCFFRYRVVEDFRYAFANVRGLARLEVLRFLGVFGVGGHSLRFERSYRHFLWPNLRFVAVGVFITRRPKYRKGVFVDACFVYRFLFSRRVR